MRFSLNRIPGKRKIILPLFFFLLLVGITNPVKGQQVRDLYLVDFSPVINDSIAQKEFFHQVDLYAINRLTLPRLYNFYYHPYLSAFIDKCWDHGIREISAGLPVAFMDSPDFERKAFSNLINSYTYEREWWNDSVNSSPVRELAQLQKLQRTNPRLYFTIYYGWFGKNDNQESLALTSVNTFENILLHHYRDRPDFGYVRDRLLTFAKAASRYRKKQNVILRISVEERYIPDISPEKMGQFFDQIMADFRIAQRQNPELNYINLQGWQIYEYGHLLD